MALEFRQRDVILRVDGDVLEIFRPRSFSERILLTWLVVEVQPSIKGSLIVRLNCSPDDRPLYEVLRKAKAALGDTAELVINTNEEPLYRQFFTQVAQLCGRPVAP
jgi:hypothetical protein